MILSVHYHARCLIWHELSLSIRRDTERVNCHLQIVDCVEAVSKPPVRWFENFDKF